MTNFSIILFKSLFLMQSIFVRTIAMLDRILRTMEMETLHDSGLN